MTWLPESFWSLYGVLGVFKVKFEFRDAQGKAKSIFNLQALSFCYPNSLVQFTLIRKELSTYGIWRSMTVVVSRFFFECSSNVPKNTLAHSDRCNDTFFPQVNKPIVKVSLQEFVSNLTKAAKAMETVSQVKSTCVQYNILVNCILTPPLTQP